MKRVQVLGTGCAKCKKLARNVEEAVRSLSLECTIEKVTDMPTIVSFGVMMTPALVVDGEVKVMGKVPTVDELRVILG